MRTRIRNIVFSLLLISILALNGCIAGENETTSSSRLIITSILGLNLEDEESTTVFVDVIDSEAGVINDPGIAKLTARLIDPTAVEPTYYQNIMVDQIDIVYTRSDGQNVEGVDVPYSFSQQVSALVEINGSTDVPFVLVNHDAKLEPPLIGLVNFGQNKILKLEAKCTIYGKDLAGNRVQPVVGYITLWCADFGDN